jgi:hypothetical protein
MSADHFGLQGSGLRGGCKSGRYLKCACHGVLGESTLCQPHKAVAMLTTAAHGLEWPV